MEDAVPESDTTDSHLAPAELPERVALPGGDGLTEEGVDEAMRAKPAVFVAIVGDRDSGKTTLACSIYEQFLRGRFAGKCFAGSRTLLAFESKTHYSRVDSGGRQPDTQRTSLSDGLRFLHLAVSDPDQPDSRRDLMFADRAGETYARARGQTALAADLIEVKKADFLVLLLDGARLANAVERAGAFQALRQTLRVFIDEGLIPSACRVQIVVTKVDRIAQAPDRTQIEEALTDFRQRLSTDFQNRVPHLSFWEVAARDPDGQFVPAHGVEPLLEEWLVKRPRSIPSTVDAGPLAHEFDRLLLRVSVQKVAP